MQTALKLEVPDLECLASKLEDRYYSSVLLSAASKHAIRRALQALNKVLAEGGHASSETTMATELLKQSTWSLLMHLEWLSHQPLLVQLALGCFWLYLVWVYQRDISARVGKLELCMRRCAHITAPACKPRPPKALKSLVHPPNLRGGSYKGPDTPAASDHGAQMSGISSKSSTGEGTVTLPACETGRESGAKSPTADSTKQSSSDRQQAQDQSKQHGVRSRTRKPEQQQQQTAALEDSPEEAIPPCVSRAGRKDFQLLSRSLGVGSFGKVHLGRWRGSSVAVKLLSPKKGACELTPGVNQQQQRENLRIKLLEQLKREVRLQALSSHPNVVRVYAVCFDPPAILMEYCKGGPLSSLLEKQALSSSLHQQDLPWQGRLRMLQGVAAAMWGLHSKEDSPLVHLDLRPANLLLANIPPTGEWVLKVADFGLAQLLGPDGESAAAPEITSSFWVPPEVLAQPGQDGFRRYIVERPTDVYAFGVVLWEVLTGKSPMNCGLGGAAVHPTVVMMAAQCGAPQLLTFPPLSDLPPDCPPGSVQPLKQLFEACTAPEPEARPDFAHIEGRLRQLLAQAVHASSEAVQEQAVQAEVQSVTTAGTAPGRSATAPSTPGLLQDITSTLGKDPSGQAMPGSAPPVNADAELLSPFLVG